MKCDKMHFSTRNKAKEYIKKQKKFKSRRRRVYKCDFCDGFHITSCSAKDIEFFRRCETWQNTGKKND